MNKLENNNSTTLGKRYLKSLRFVLYPLGFWPGLAFEKNAPMIILLSKYIWPTTSTLMIASEIYFLWKHLGHITAFLAGEVSLALALTFVTVMRNCLPLFKRYGTIFAKYTQQIHLIHFRHKEGIYEKIYQSVEKASNILTNVMVLMTVFGAVLFNFVPTYNVYKNNMIKKKQTDESIQLQFSINWQLPGYDQQEKPYIVTLIINGIQSYVCSISIVAMDLMVMLMVFQIVGHIKILEYNLRNIEFVDPTDSPVTTIYNFNYCKDVMCNMFDHNTNLNICEQLIRCVDHHRLIVSFADELSDFFGPTLAANYLFHLLGCGLVLFECSQGDPEAFIRFGILAVIIFAQLVILSVIFEVVTTASENLSSALYSCPWERMNIQNRRLVSIMLLRMQTPIQVTAMGMTTVGVQTMAAILKTTFSYFTFLRSKNT